MRYVLMLAWFLGVGVGAVVADERSSESGEAALQTTADAVVKADGTGLNENTKNINTYPDSKNGYSIPYKNYRLWTFYNKKNDFIVSVAVENDIKNVLCLDCCYLPPPQWQ